MNLMVDGNKLFLNLAVQVLRLLYHLPNGRNEKRVCPRWCRSLMILAVLSQHSPYGPFDSGEVHM